MLRRNVSSKLRALRQKNDLGFLLASSSRFSTKAKDSSSPASDVQNHIHGQARSFSSSSSTTGAPPRKNPAPPPSSSSASSAPPGTDYVTLFQPSYGNALTGLGAYTPGILHHFFTEFFAGNIPCFLFFRSSFLLLFRIFVFIFVCDVEMWFTRNCKQWSNSSHWTW